MNDNRRGESRNRFTGVPPFIGGWNARVHLIEEASASSGEEALKWFWRLMTHSGALWHTTAGYYH
jgi:hypothetical protein